MKRLLALLLSVSIFASLLTSCGQENQPNSSQPTLDENQVEIKQDEDSLEQQAIYPLNAIKKLPEIEPYQGVRPYSEHWFDNLYIDADLSDNVSLAYSLTISDKTTFKKMPAGYNADDLIEWGKSPGLNVDILHKYGFTGAGEIGRASCRERV